MTNQQGAPEAPKVRTADYEAGWKDGYKQGAWAAQQPAPSPAATVGNSGFDYHTAADVLNGKTVSDEAIRKFVSASRWAHDDRAGLRATLLSVRGELASREAEIVLLKNALMGAEEPQPSTTAQADTQPAPVLDEREEFEAWLRSVWTAGYSCPKLDSGKYEHGEAQRFWECWQARASHGQAPAEASPTAGMNIPQRILHVGGRNNDAGYVEFGSIQAVEALVRQVLRDLPAQADSVLEDAARLDWLEQQCEGYGFQDIHEGNRWEISGPYANVRQAIDAARAAQKEGKRP